MKAINKILGIEVVGLTVIALGLVVSPFLAIPQWAAKFSCSLVVMSSLWIGITMITFVSALLKISDKGATEQ